MNLYDIKDEIEAKLPFVTPIQYKPSHISRSKPNLSPEKDDLHYLFEDGASPRLSAFS